MKVQVCENWVTDGALPCLDGGNNAALVLLNKLRDLRHNVIVSSLHDDTTYSIEAECQNIYPFLMHSEPFQLSGIPSDTRRFLSAVRLLVLPVM